MGLARSFSVKGRTCYCFSLALNFKTEVVVEVMTIVRLLGVRGGILCSPNDAEMCH